jgi:alginate O-acetyltransferase complex protein AlgI
VVFSSFTFLFVFLPIFLAVYYLLSAPSLLRGRGFPRAIANLTLFGFSLLFYAWGEGFIVLVMLLSTVIDYFASLVIAGAFGAQRGRPLEPLPENGARTPAQKIALTISILANLSLLGFFKYFNFFLDNLNAGLSTCGLSAWQIHDFASIALPIGISFYTFQTMSYTIDVYRGVVPATRNFIDFAAFVTMFPQLVAGPIVRYKDVEPALRERSVSLDDFAEGVRRFVIGLGKKVLIADAMAVVADRVYALPGEQLTTGLAWIGSVSFALQLYYDFSGYSDMAIGLGRMLGFRFLENFTYPYISRSLREYWTRWHISLSTWFRDYLFFSLGGSRVAQWRIFFNLVVVFLLCGLWHGASWTFVIWGMAHGIVLLAERQGLGRLLEKLWLPLQHVYLLTITLVTKVIFRSTSIEQAGDMLAALAGFAPGTGQQVDARIFLDPEFLLIFTIGLIGCMPVLPWLKEALDRARERSAGLVPHALAWTQSALQFAGLVAILLLSIVMISYVDYTPFLYFRF